MTIFESKVSLPEKPWCQIPDTRESILKDLTQYALNPVFEDYGNFVYVPEWQDAEAEEKYKGLTAISGNFLTVSHSFRVLTDDAEMIAELEEAIRKNQETEAYQAARQRRLQGKRRTDEVFVF